MMKSTQLSVIERAIELARTGRFLNAGEVRKALSRERFANVEGYISGSVAKQIAALCRQNSSSGPADTNSAAASQSRPAAEAGSVEQDQADTDDTSTFTRREASR